MLVRVLAQDPLLLQRLAIPPRAAGFRIQFNRNHQPAAADLLHRIGADLSQPVHEIGPFTVGIFDHPLVNQNPERGPRHRAGKRVAAERRSVLTRLQHPQHVGIRQHGGDWIKTARKRLADKGDVGLDLFMLLGQQTSGPAQPGLDLVQDQGDVAFGTDLTHPAEVPLRRNDHAGLALNRFNQEGHRVFAQRGLERLDIAEPGDAEARRERPEAAARRRIGGETDNAKGPAVEVVGADNDLGLIFRHPLDLVTPFPDRLDRALDRFRAGIHRQNLVRPGQGGDFLIERRQLVVAEGARGEGQAGRLLDHGFQDLRMAMPLIDGGIGRQTVEIPVAVHIPDMHALAPADHHVDGLVVMRPKARLGLNQVGGYAFIHNHGSVPNSPGPLGGAGPTHMVRRAELRRRAVDDLLAEKAGHKIDQQQRGFAPVVQERVEFGKVQRGREAGICQHFHDQMRLAIGCAPRHRCADRGRDRGIEEVDIQTDMKPRVAPGGIFQDRRDQARNPVLVDAPHVHDRHAARRQQLPLDAVDRPDPEQMEVGRRDGRPVHPVEQRVQARFADKPRNRHAVNVPAGGRFRRVIVGMRVQPQDDEVTPLIPRGTRHGIDRAQRHAVVAAHEDREIALPRDLIARPIDRPGPGRDLDAAVRIGRDRQVAAVRHGVAQRLKFFQQSRRAQRRRPHRTTAQLGSGLKRHPDQGDGFAVAHVLDHESPSFPVCPCINQPGGDR